jgi:hypothetical protein
LFGLKRVVLHELSADGTWVQTEIRSRVEQLLSARGRRRRGTWELDYEELVLRPRLLGRGSWRTVSGAAVFSAWSTYMQAGGVKVWRLRVRSVDATSLT